MYYCVNEGAFCLNQYTHVAVLAGESATLYCYGSCGRVTWWMNSDMIVQSGQLIDKGNITERFDINCNCQTSLCELTILSAQVEDAGHYLCYSSNDYYSTVTILCQLPVTCLACAKFFLKM